MEPKLKNSKEIKKIIIGLVIGAVVIVVAITALLVLTAEK